MAKIKTSSLLAEIRGNLGGTIFSSNGAGFYCKSWTRPTQPRTLDQVGRRSTFSNIARTWQTLTAGQLATWTAYAAQGDNVRYDWFGDPYYPSAYNQFQAVNIFRLKSGAAIALTAPTGAKPAALPSMTAYVDFQASITNSTLTRNAAFDPSIAAVHVMFRFWYSTSRLTPPRPLDYLEQVLFTSFPIWDFQSYLAAKYGDMPSAGRWYLEAYPMSVEARTGAAKVFSGLNQTSVTV